MILNFILCALSNAPGVLWKLLYVGVVAGFTCQFVNTCNELMRVQWLSHCMRRLDRRKAVG